jgi:hypothetical protein
MSFDYTDIIDVADELLAEYGAVCSLGVVTVGAYDPATGAATSTSTATSITAALFGFPQRFIDGAMILTGDQRALISPLTTAGAALTAPKAGDTLTDSLGAVFRVIDCKTIAPAGTPVLCIAQVRK